MIWRLLFIMLLACAAAPAARAQSARTPASEDRTEEAKGLFNAGRAAFDAGRFADALDYFQQSYAISGRAALLYNIGLTLDRMREDQRALEAYEQYLSAAPDARNRAEVETRIAALRAALSREQATVEKTKPAETAAPAPTPAEAAQAAQAAPPQSAQPEPAALATQPAPEARDRGEGGLLTKWWFWTAVGVAVAGGVSATLIALSGDDEPAAPLEPGTGIIVTTLRSAP